jgi:small subunit ribosomal protein S15
MLIISSLPVATDTVKIRKMQDLYARFPRNTRLKVSLKELIEKRKSRLNKLRDADYKRFEWVLEKLNLEYKLKPEYGTKIVCRHCSLLNFFISRNNDRITRKKSMTMLVEEYCEGERQAKLSELKSKLQIEREKFEEEKKQLLEWIAKEEETCEKLKQANV